MTGILDELADWHDPEPLQRLAGEAKREYSRLTADRRKKERLERIRFGLCGICGSPAAKRDGGKRLTKCERCLDRDRECHRKYKASTTCRSCKVRTKKPGTESCKVCALKQRVLEAKRRIEQRRERGAT